jgi:quercetin dioxygenase-like cupin family protein
MTPAPPRTGTATPIWFIDNIARVHVDGGDSSGALDLVECEARRGDMPPLHVHREHDETFYVLDGEVTLHLPGRALRLGRGDAAFAPRGVPHAYRVESQTARWVVAGTPAGFADFVREVSDEPESDGFPPAGRDLDPARLAEAAARHGIELLGPPGMVP